MSARVDLKQSGVSAVTASLGRLFHSGIVLGKKENLYKFVLQRIVLIFSEWDRRVERFESIWI